MNKNEVINKNIEYLKEAGVNDQVLKYIKENHYLVSEKLNELIGRDMYSIYKERDIETLRNGNDSFKITEDGGIWIANERDGEIPIQDKTQRIAGTTYSFKHNYRIIDKNIKNVKDYDYIFSRDDQIVHQAMTIEQEEKNNEEFYNGKITEKVFDDNLKLVETETSMWNKEESGGIPNKELLATKCTYEKGAMENWVRDRKSFNKNYQNDSEWQFVVNGKNQGEKLKDDIKESTRSSNIVLDGVKNFFSNMRDKMRGVER